MAPFDGTNVCAGCESGAAFVLLLCREESIKADGWEGAVTDEAFGSASSRSVLAEGCGINGGSSPAAAADASTGAVSATTDVTNSVGA